MHTSIASVSRFQNLLYHRLFHVTSNCETNDVYIYIYIHVSNTNYSFIGLIEKYGAILCRKLHIFFDDLGTTRNFQMEKLEKFQKLLSSFTPSKIPNYNIYRSKSFESKI